MHLSEIGSESGGLCHRFLRPFTASLDRGLLQKPRHLGILAPPRPKLYIPLKLREGVSLSAAGEEGSLIKQVD